MFVLTISGAVMRRILFALTGVAIGLSLCAPGIVLAQGDRAMPGKPLATPNALGERIATGVFQGIEQGDHFYFRLRTTGGDEEKFMILREIGGLAVFTKNPKAQAGRKVNLLWVERIENIPEADGRIKVRVAVGVEAFR